LSIQVKEAWGHQTSLTKIKSLHSILSWKQLAQRTEKGHWRM
jgi:hypothetical protein